MHGHKLCVAEKPSSMRIFADVLGVVRRGDGFIECKGGWVVTHLRGHVWESYQPEEYDPALKNWRPESLPFSRQSGSMRCARRRSAATGAATPTSTRR